MKDQIDAANACRILHQAARLNYEDSNRAGSLLRFGTFGQLVMTGDLHGNLRNFEKLQRFCDLKRCPGRFVILHELIHQESAERGQPDTSIDLLLRAAEWKCEYPDNVYFLQSNHELAQYRGQEITKGGRSVLHDFDQGVALRYGAAAAEVLAAVREYIASLPLAARTASDIFLAHSLPDPLTIESFDLSVLDRIPTAADLSPGGAAYSLVWGRFHTPRVVEFLAQRLKAELFVVGHTPQEFGYATVGRLIILASDHNHGVFLPIDLGRRYTVEQLTENIRKFAGVE